MQQTAESVYLTMNIAGNASNSATQSNETMQKTIDMMHTISADNNQIVDIIGVIDRIAFQTNILALNASVEAARAGMPDVAFLLWPQRCATWRCIPPLPPKR